MRTSATLLIGLILGRILPAQTTQIGPEDLKRANALTQSGKLEEAIPIYQQLIGAFPHETSLKLNLAIAFYKAKRYRETAQECDGVASSEPGMFPAWLFLGAARYKLDDARGAEMPLRKAVALRPDDPNARIFLADVLARKEDQGDSVRQYFEAAQRMPSLPRAWYGLSRGYLLLAHEALARLNAMNRNSPEALILSGDFDLEADQIPAAFTHYRSALRLNATFAGLRSKIAAIYSMTGHPNWAELERQKALIGGQDKCPPSPDLECAFAAGELEQAALAQANTPQEIYWQAEAFLELSRRAYDKLTSLPPSAERYEAQAQRSEIRGQFPEAAEAWHKAIQLDPESEELQRGLALAQCHGNDCGAALPLLKRKAQENQESVEWNYLCGLSLVATRDPLQAIPYLEKALRLDRAFADTRGALGEAYFEAGRPQDAIALLKESVEQNDNALRQYQLARAYRASGDQIRAQAALNAYREYMKNTRGDSIGASAITPP
jgi:predicted Zn-dependent protease